MSGYLHRERSLMAKKNKVIFVLIDALGANYFLEHRERMPYLAALADSNLFAERVQPATPGTSRPGRATILTGVDTSIHGVYGNSILDGDFFRPATENDVQATTVAQAALEAGLDVVGLGFGLLRPEDTTVQIDPWWEHLQYKGPSNIKIPSRRENANVAPVRRDPKRRLSPFLNAPLTAGSSQSADVRLHPHMIGLASDQLMLRLAGDLACGDQPPDLILTEFSITDVIQHHHGFDSAATNWAYQTADMAVGLLMHRLSKAGRLNDYVVIIASDHGQAPIHTAIYPELVVPHDSWTSEGASLNVVVTDVNEALIIADRLSRLGVAPLDGMHLPAAVRAKGLITFVAPTGYAFERRPDKSAMTETTGSPSIVSTHGLSPGHPGDDAIAIVAGAGARGCIASGDLTQVAPTIAQALGLDLPSAHGLAWI
ncbi:alkaline phosphatase family protein [Mesorhizobium onobrychidis]|uniref:Alkaline phosphatase family protein n=1 Tax=Mesorhizobium onobrychidis TaxID=2775404 RepID=A0ABY5QVR3_9HYPH|nr:alkaline phosphatase family protein [Mesorhizobium onobrychidis]UVC15188.1 alkaline phosphatase family protein [Mesorhizobium onobrychidis]